MESIHNHINQAENGGVHRLQHSGINKSMPLVDNRSQSLFQNNILEDNRPEMKSSIFSKNSKIANNQGEKKPIEHKQKDISRVGTLADLHEAPVTLPRTKQQEKEDLLKVNALLTTIAKKEKTTEDIAAYFPAIKKRYQLTQIGFEKNGSKGVHVHVNINPSFYFTDFNGNKMNIATHVPENDPQYQERKLTLPSGGKSDNVGISMIDHILTPSHVKGSSPKDSAQKSLFEGLPTKKKVPKGNGTSKYIKGHLLNDNLGGPGEAKNLFPITVQANDDHKRKIEKDAKHLVNEEGLYVYYDVIVKNATNPVDTGIEFNKQKLYSVNADFVCHLSPLRLSNTGKFEKKSFKSAIIHSKYGGKVKPKVKPGSDDFEDIEGIYKQPNFNPKAVQWAPSHDNRKSTLFSPEALKELEEFSDETDFLLEVQSIYGIGPAMAKLAWKAFNNGPNPSLHDSEKGNETKAIKAINAHMAIQQKKSGYSSARKGEALSTDETESFVSGHQTYINDHAEGYKIGSRGDALQAGRRQGVGDGFHKAHYDMGYQLRVTGQTLPFGATQGQIAGYQAYQIHHDQGYQLGINEQPLPHMPSQGLRDGYQRYIDHFNTGHQAAMNGHQAPGIGAAQGIIDGYVNYQNQAAPMEIDEEPVLMDVDPN